MTPHMALRSAGRGSPPEIDSKQRLGSGRCGSCCMQEQIGVMRIILCGWHWGGGFFPAFEMDQSQWIQYNFGAIG